MILEGFFVFLLFLFIIVAVIGCPLLIGLLVYFDAKKKNTNAILWALAAALVPCFIGLIVYLIVRKDYADITVSAAGQNNNSNPSSNANQNQSGNGKNENQETDSQTSASESVTYNGAPQKSSNSWVKGLVIAIIVIVAICFVGFFFSFFMYFFDGSHYGNSILY